ncbi:MULTISPECIES: YtxH domain-containing protein [Shewanella]|uniref:Membrane protein n=1 Tax=Shewanella japonica TaxID=93973 RepID=A0ABN4YNX4_9GAMM|nr:MULTISPECIES: YtxH domain-containing protein [Shewanella]ARD24100.1 Membrane protein [Shewanella japonica]KPZ69112.1 hypothetical protein AN944_03128 [Shewanella sp. P1-14-1]MBQ4891350.1 YtxH domain-containing protein [Shewanella sp. MMG014]OBT04711.1 hypothetical protein A9267_17350 [Shewanella sp. UCD-FRSSP16_17]GIU49187.1 hypothetical protein TUM4249_06270 [Shewanella sp. KT0246]
MNNYPPYGYGYGYGPAGQAQQAQSAPTENAAPYKAQNTKTHFMMGLAAGAAVAYLISNKKVQQSVASTGEKAWSTVRGEVEELKERLEDTQAELDYYRNLHKGE